MATALVTGSSTGIGRATALKFAAEGYRVYGSVRSEASGQALLDAAGDDDVSLLVMDVDDDRSVTDAVGGLLADIGTLDVLVNNAGISNGGPVEDTDLATFQQVMNTNAFGVVRCTQAVLPAMRAAGAGAIVNVTSVSGVLCTPPMSAYAMSKYAAEAFTEVLAGELAPHGIRVAAVEPGVIITPIFEKAMANPSIPSPAYRQPSDRMSRFFMSALADPTTPDVVADVIYEAVTTDEPKLRWPAGRDAEQMVPARQAMSDEDWIALNTHPDDDAWRTGMSNVTGFSIS